MAAQTNYSYSTPAGVAGGKADLAWDYVASRRNESEDGKLKFGMAAQVGTDPANDIKVPNGATKDQILGVVVRDQNTEEDMSGEVVLKKNRTCGVMTHGRIWGRLAKDAKPTAGAAANLCVTGDDAGCFTEKAVASGIIDIGAKFGDLTDDGIAVVVL